MKSDRQSTIAMVVIIVAIIIVIWSWAQYRIVALSSNFSKNPIRPNPVKLIANSNNYDGALVFLIGYCEIRFEHDVLHVLNNDEAEIPPYDTIWLELEEVERSQHETPIPKRCRVTGIFREGPSGHLGTSFGKISPVTELAFYPESGE